jgi:hypothetical protein
VFGEKPGSRFKSLRTAAGKFAQRFAKKER